MSNFKTKRYLIIIISISICISMFACNSNKDKKYFGKIGDVEINQGEFLYFLNTSKSLIENENKVEDSEAFWMGKIGNERAKDVAINKTFEMIQEYKIVLDNAKKDNIELTIDEETDAVNELNKQIKNEGGQKKFNENLKQKYKIDNFTEYKEIFLNMNLIDKYVKSMVISDKQIKEFMDKKENYDLYVKNKFIVITLKITSTMNQKEKDSVKLKAEDILKKLQSNEDPEKLVLEFSEDQNKEKTKGLYLLGRSDDASESFMKWFDSVEEGNSGIIKVTDGYYVVKLLKKYVGTEEATVKNIVENAIRKVENEEEIKKKKKDKKYKIEKNSDVLINVKV